MRVLNHQPGARLSIRQQRHCLVPGRCTQNSRAPAVHHRTSRPQTRAQAAGTAVTSSDAEPPADLSSKPEVPEGIAEPMSEEAVLSEKQRRKKLWFAAVKPPMYTVSIIPILVSMAAAHCWLL